MTRPLNCPRCNAILVDSFVMHQGEAKKKTHGYDAKDGDIAPLGRTCPKCGWPADGIDASTSFSDSE